ncbi:unnamed protein product (macronuclear) [Paramecium tetraurelia]|uniref:SPX domain-containing protein n=1 Tax=Paramecium tetraurelia TaxID=5888 RepID=A0DGU0_PARTE|nr:uncharacterized protein GSPATT00002386001 [Paramecium tetraurelia]CAK82257.1 unnamed protein product [Paramecium tetraurelia]|eukprot:XP_001449654.1 hypothetical protein (macronuclear) [Paramecium tetraurelia strain d4-2]
MNSKLQVKSDEGKFKQTICEFITKEEAQLTYEEENMQKFKRKIELFEQNLCQYFFKCYQTMRLDQFVEIKEKQVTGKEKLLELSKQLHQLKQTKKKQLFQLNLKECYFTQKLRAAKCLLEKL